MTTRAFEERPRSQIIEVSEEGIERRSLMNNTQVLHPRWAKKSRTSIFNKVMAIVNLVLGIILATSIGIIAHESSKQCTKSIAHAIEPYSPALEAVVPVVKKFRSEPIFQRETSDAVEMAWKEIEGVNGGIVVLGPEESTKLSKTGHESVASKLEPEKHFYVISMYQQLRCLNIIRKSFYREQLYSDLTDEMFQVQKSNDCFDFLRQAIQCHGDVSMTYFKNKNHTSGREEFGDPSYEGGKDLVSELIGASVFWDVEHSCRALEPIEAWVAEHQGH